MALGLLGGVPPAAGFVCVDAGGDGGSSAGPFAFACGSSAKATGLDTAIGTGADATGSLGGPSGASSNVAIGFVPDAKGVGGRNIAIGDTAKSFGDSGGNIAIGAFSQAHGVGTANTAIGSHASATGANSAAFGAGAEATHANSTAIGPGAKTTRDDQMMLGKDANTYTMAGVASQASKDEQAKGGGPQYFVTTNPTGDLAAHTAADLGLATQTDIAALQTQINGLAQRDRELADGIAIAVAMAQPILLPGQTFALRMGYGNFDGSSALGLSAAGVISKGFAGPTSSVTLDVGAGFATDTNVAAGRAGVTFGF